MRIAFVRIFEISNTKEAKKYIMVTLKIYTVSRFYQLVVKMLPKLTLKQHNHETPKACSV